MAASYALEGDTSKFGLGGWNWTFNATLPSPKDLALAGPRMVMKLGSFLTFPDAIDNIIYGGRFGQTIIPEATGFGAGMADAVTTAAAGTLRSGQAAQAGAQLLADLEEPTAGLTSRFTMEGVRSLGSVFSYATSRWALGCIVVAVILNRTGVYASTRRNLILPWWTRLFIRAIPILLLSIQAVSLLQSMQCQTSSDFGLLRWNNASKSSDLLFTQKGGFLHELSSTLLLGAPDKASCLAVNMIPPDYDDEDLELIRSGKMSPVNLTGSLARLWPLFQTFSFSQFIETLSCAVSGRIVAGETGMTLFEHSLAFAEAEGAIGNQLGFGSFGSTKNGQWSNTTSTVEASEIAITRSMILGKVNTTPEVLLVGFLSSMNHLTSHILAIFNLQGRLRLLNTGFWGLSFMAAIVWSIWTFSLDNLPDQMLLRFPTVCIVGFIPHVLVLLGIIGCSLIYGAALILSALAPPAVAELRDNDEGVTSQATFKGRIIAAHRNMQANVPLSNISITMHMDFYTALLRTGFACMTMASEAVYLNESRGVSIKQRTWLEEDRLLEIEAVGAQWLGPAFKLHEDDGSADGLSDNVGLVPSRDQPMDLLQRSASGYAREMITKKASLGGRPRQPIGMGGPNGVGATERSGRWIMALEFFLGINRLLLSWWASVILKLMGKAGFQFRPRWLLWLARVPKPQSVEEKTQIDHNSESLKFWILRQDGELVLPDDEQVDVEEETRRRLQIGQGYWNDGEEKKLDSKLYSWWMHGGWWGNEDHSGAFEPDQSDRDEDTTSVVSFSTNASEGWESDGADDDGRRTPTQRHPKYSREASPFNDTPLNLSDLAQLLHPKTPEQRAEAQALAAHLASEKVMTRSQYRNVQQRERAKVLTSTLHRPSNFTPSSLVGKLSLEEEAQVLEHLIISRRNYSAVTGGRATSWSRDAAGMGEDGPQCVVCQSSPRSIIVWPCRCLSLCDDCRVTLAMNNFDKCVCCRRDVVSFSRIFVP